MPLPQQVIEQLGREPEKTQGWATGTILFSAGILFLVALMYFGMKFGYEPYVNGQLEQTQKQVAAANQSVSTSDELQIINFYSQIANLKTALANHVYISTFLGWLEKNTQANVSYPGFGLSSGGQASLNGSAKTEADINQQVAIFESSPLVANMVISNISPAPGGTGFSFEITLTMVRSAFASKLPQ